MLPKLFFLSFLAVSYTMYTSFHTSLGVISILPWPSAVAPSSKPSLLTTDAFTIYTSNALALTIGSNQSVTFVGAVSGITSLIVDDITIDGNDITSSGTLSLEGTISIIGGAISGVTTLSMSGTLTSTGSLIDMTKNSAGSVNTIQVYNSNNANATSHARLQAVVGGASGGDPNIKFTVSAATDWSIGIDNSDSDSLKIDTSDTPGGSTKITINTTGDTSFASATDSTSGTTGSINTACGIGVVKNIVISTGDLIITTATTPATAGATGQVGTIAWDVDYIYICTATNAWERVAIATW